MHTVVAEVGDTQIRDRVRWCGVDPIKLCCGIVRRPRSLVTGLRLIRGRRGDQHQARCSQGLAQGGKGHLDTMCPAIRIVIAQCQVIIAGALHIGNGYVVVQGVA